MKAAIKHPFRSTAQKGFTLIELMIAVAILAILMGIAIPSYNQWVIKSNRAEAKSTLMDAAQRLERCFTRFSAYNDGNCSLQQGDTLMSESDKYQVQVTSTGATTFDLTAVPQGGQTHDAECMNFTLDHTGARDISGTGDADDCW